ncbi:unnamed protein product, partial [marine sediment metagenome]
MTKNEYANNWQKKKAEEDNLEFYYTRTGKCDPGKCQSLCCRIDGCSVDNSFADTRFHFDFTFKGKFGDYMVKHKHCEQMELNGRCKL